MSSLNLSNERLRARGRPVRDAPACALSFSFFRLLRIRCVDRAPEKQTAKLKAYTSMTAEIKQF
jgi:hypothetical protein